MDEVLDIISVHEVAALVAGGLSAVDIVLHQCGMLSPHVHVTLLRLCSLSACSLCDT